MARVAVDAVGADARRAAEVLPVDVGAALVGGGGHRRLSQDLADAALVVCLAPPGHGHAAQIRMFIQENHAIKAILTCSCCGPAH